MAKSKTYTFSNSPFSCDKSFITDKARATGSYISYMLNKSQSIFKYENLPDTLPRRNLELMLQTNGNVFITEHNGNLYAFTGGLGGEPNEYYEPTEYIVANPYLHLSKSYKIDDEGTLVRNDSLMMGLLPLFKRYAYQLAEADVSLWRASVNSRAMPMVTGSDDNALKAAELFFSKLEDGVVGVVADKGFTNELTTFPMSTNSGANYLTQLIELRQYWLANWYQELGINANYNMKREAINEAEAGLNDDALLPFIDDMLRCRKEAIDKVNEKYGTDIQVSLFSSWEPNREVNKDEPPEDELQEDEEETDDADKENTHEE